MMCSCKQDMWTQPQSHCCLNRVKSAVRVNIVSDTALSHYTPDHITKSFMTNRVCVCLSLFMSVWTVHTHSGLRVQRFVCVCVLDLLTHVFNWNSMQSAYCSTNRICTWWCQPQILQRPFECVLRSRTHSQTRPSGLLDWNSTRN